MVFLSFLLQVISPMGKKKEPQFYLEMFLIRIAYKK